MIDSGQLLERFRQLAREIQNGLQTSEKNLELAQRSKDSTELGKVSAALALMSEAWQDFSGWIHISTLENLEDARANCAPGRVDVASKIKRSKLRCRNQIASSGVTIDISEAKESVIETYIPYFEQLLDLLVGNAVKYSPRAGSIEISCARTKNGVSIFIRSMGPVVLKHEISQLGDEGFRTANAQKLPITGQGYGLYNCRRLSDLLGATIDFRPEHRVLYESNGVPFGHFVASLNLPDDPLPIST